MTGLMHAERRPLLPDRQRPGGGSGAAAVAVGETALGRRATSSTAFNRSAQATSSEGGVGLLRGRLIELFFSHKVPRNQTTLRLMRRMYVDSLLLHQERETVIGGLWIVTGYRQIGIAIEKPVRKGTTYSFHRRWYDLIDAVASFSNAPLIMIFYLGVFISLAAFLFAAYLVLRWLFVGVGVTRVAISDGLGLVSWWRVHILRRRYRNLSCQSVHRDKEPTLYHRASDLSGTRHARHGACGRRWRAPTRHE